MRNELLNGYVIHHRKYREKSYIIHIFSEEYGRVDGILRQVPPPQYQPIRVYATGKGELKNFSHLELSYQPVFLTGDAFFVGFYLNELLLKLSPVEQDMPQTFHQYQKSIEILKILNQSPQMDLELRQMLRQFEYVFLQDLGYLVNYESDSMNEEIQEHCAYRFSINDGFVPCMPDKNAFSGKQILTMHNDFENGFSIEQLNFLNKLHRLMINDLLGDKPLKSRQLWIQHKQKLT